MQKPETDQLVIAHCNLSACGFGRSRRLLDAHEYKAVFDHNNFRASDKNALLLARLNQQTSARLGLVISKKNVRLAVDRNRLKRIAREQFRLYNQFAFGLDIIIMARPHLGEMSSRDFAALIYSLFENIQRQCRRTKTTC